MSGYRVGAPVRLRAFRHRYITWALRGERRRMWRTAVYYHSPSGKRGADAFRVKMLGMLDEAQRGLVTSIADRVDCAIVDRALRAAWSPEQGDA